MISTTLRAIVVLVLCGPAAALTLDEALRIALDDGPAMAAAAADAEAARAEARQASAWPNPSLFLDLENAPRDGDLWRGADRVMGVAWSVPWSGRRGAFAEGARFAAKAAEAERSVARLETERRVRRAFAAVLHARAVIEVRERSSDTAEDAADIAETRVRAGDTPADVAARARIARAVAMAGLGEARARSAGAIAELAALLGTGAEEAAAASGELGAHDSVIGAVSDHPAVRSAEARVAASEALARSTSRASLPDLDLSLGVRRVPGDDASTLDLGVGLSLPLFDRRGGDRAKARAGVVAAEAFLRQAVADRDRRREAAVEAHDRAAETVRLFGADLIPAADALLAAAERRYAVGDTDLDALLRADREWCAARLAELDARLALDIAAADLIALQ